MAMDGEARPGTGRKIELKDQSPSLCIIFDLDYRHCNIDFLR